MNNKDLLNKLESLKNQGNDYINTKDYKNAIKIYENALDISTKELTDFKPKDNSDLAFISDIHKIKKKCLSNMALCYFKLEDYDKSIDIDKSILSIDIHYDKSFARLYLAYKNKNLLNVAVEYGNHLLKGFDDKTLEKYKDIIDEIKKYNEDQIFLKNLKKHEILLKRIIPLIVGILLGLYFYLKKK